MKEVRNANFSDILFYIMFSLIILFIIVMCGLVYDMLNDYRCSQLPIDKFYSDNRCRYYWDEVNYYEVERKHYD